MFVDLSASDLWKYSFVELGKLEEACYYSTAGRLSVFEH